MNHSVFNVQLLNLIDYDHAIMRMNQLHAERVANQVSDTLLVLEHPPVITRGRRLQDLPLQHEADLAKLGIQIRNANRGGELTYHGPGQIVVYFIVDVENYTSGIANFVQLIEKSVINFLKRYGLETQLKCGHPGIWWGEKKLASIGLRVSQGITQHGLALNIKNDLNVYQLFSPCGLQGSTMTHLQQALQCEFSEDEYKALTQDFADCLVSDLELAHQRKNNHPA